MHHVGLYPDFVRDVRNVGVTFEHVTFEQTGPRLISAADLHASWERA